MSPYPPDQEKRLLRALNSDYFRGDPDDVDQDTSAVFEEKDVLLKAVGEHNDVNQFPEEAVRILEKAEVQSAAGR